MPDTVDTLGKIMVREALPGPLKHHTLTLDKKGVEVLFKDMAENYPDEYIETLQKLNSLSSKVNTDRGREASISVRDFVIPPKLRILREQVRKDIYKILQTPGLSPKEKDKQVLEYMSPRIQDIQRQLSDEAYETGNTFGFSVKHGIRGSPLQLTQILFGDMIVADHKGRPIPYPGLHSYSEGLTPAEYFASSYGSRKGMADVQFATADAGYLGKQMAYVANRVRVTGKDCGAQNVGIFKTSDDPDVMGAVLARDNGNIPAGTIISKDNIRGLKGKVLVRSAITCQQPQGVCQLCTGLRETGKFSPIGHFVGVDAARIISEPLTQLGLSTKHLGGSFSGHVSDDISGFEEINQFQQVPKYFRGRSVLASKDGKVLQIADAPQGGSYINIDGEQLYSPLGRELLVKKGDYVEAGDMLTDGTPNPAEIATYKGLGEGRKYFVDKMAEILDRNKVSTHKRNIELLSRGFFDRIKITSPDGAGGYDIGQKVPYTDFQRDYVPREGSEIKTVGPGLRNYYLEKPVLHYSIGTRLTPNVLKFIKDNSINEVVVHPKHPGFEPETVRLIDVVASDPDWKTRLMGFGLERAFLDSATHGSESPHKTTSYVPELMNVKLMDKNRWDESE